ncbi:HAMP domain-containing histidine kinase [Candidatus Kaiserbacteria bacterium]|nr:HAMP domain-containing histidine kinase [Candidatus Kaiserbacteria bacterium]
MDPSESSQNAVTLHLHWVAFARDISILIMGVVFPPLIASIFIHNVVSGDVAVAIARITPLFGAFWALLVWMAAALVWTKYYLSLWVVTDRHLVYINQVNIFNRQVATWDIAAVESVVTSAEDPLSATLDYGTVWIKTPEAGESEYIIATPIPHPETMGEAIRSRIPAPIQAPSEEEALIQQTTDAISGQSAETQAALVRSISHEMKGHLTRSQMTFAAIIAGDFGEVPEGLKDIAGQALADSREGVETVMDILNSANIKKGTLMMEKETFDLLETIRESVNSFRPEAAQRGVELRFRDKIGSCLIEGDRPKLSHHVFRNLIDNAIRYTPSGTIDVDLTWDIAYATFSVIDSGVGITPEDMAHLFTEGGKGSHSTQVNPQSTGYGLYVAKLVAEGHGGKIWAESDGPGTGSRFFVKLPLHPSAKRAL